MAGDGYPDVEWIPAHRDRFSVSTSRRVITDIVLHITDGGAVDSRVTARNLFAMPPEVAANGTLLQQSSHYIVGRDGHIVQCVRHNDIAFHANLENGYSLGIEHNARDRTDKTLEDIQYYRSAELCVWLGQMLGIPMDRMHISGHSEIDPGTTHASCPQRALDYRTYMKAVADVQAAANGKTVMRLWGQ